MSMTLHVHLPGRTDDTTIGSTHNHPADLRITPDMDPLPWSARFPNPPDLCFDYRRLVEQAGGIAQATKATHRICIVGAGVTGLVAARELLRCGFTEITLIEKAKRVGGRHFTVVDGPEDYKKPSTPFELGAMRMPFFNRTGEPPEAGRSLMAYYSQLFGLRTSDFPNPGTPWVNATGIYMREGQLEGQGEPTLLIWQNSDGSTPPPGAALQRVHDKWERFAQRFAEKVAASYGTRMWETLWRQIVERYQSLSFRQLVELPFLDVLDPDRPGDFGGLGMTEDESSIFYAIGIGDGSWAPFMTCAVFTHCVPRCSDSAVTFSSFMAALTSRECPMPPPIWITVKCRTVPARCSRHLTTWVSARWMSACCSWRYPKSSGHSTHIAWHAPMVF